jgi:deoxyadenosine/deoxycytidine kinase
MSQIHKPILITVEGNIGSGKSTMIKLIKEKFQDWVIIDEPVGEWLNMRNDEGKSLLELFYTDKTRWSYTFQNAAFITRYLNCKRALQQANGKVIFISERGILTDRYVFATMLHDEGLLTSIEWDLYTKWFDCFKDDITINGIIYIDTPSDICKERIIKRNRGEGEDTISIDYLQQLEKYHNQWLDNYPQALLKISSEPSEMDKIYNFVQLLLR